MEKGETVQGDFGEIGWKGEGEKMHSEEPFNIGEKEHFLGTSLF